MVWLGAVGGGCFVLACIVLGVRLLLLFRHTRELPEGTLGLGLLLMGGVSYPLVVVARAVPDLADTTRIATVVTAQLLMAIGVTAVGIFNWRVFRPGSPLGGIVAASLALAFLGLMGAQAAGPGFLTFALENQGALRWTIPVTGAALYWATFETWRYHGLLRRRRALGMADPVVLDRMRLWGITTSAASVINVSTIVCQLLGIDPATAAIPSLITGVMGLVCAGSLWLAFFPPAFYRRRIPAAE